MDNINYKYIIIVIIGLCTEDQSGKLWFGLVCHIALDHTTVVVVDICVRVMDY